jgi:glutathione S-transferase
MADEVIFYHNPRSRAQMAHWMLEEVGAPYRIHPIDFATAEHKAPDFLAINPMGKLPTITHRGVVVTETAAIIAISRMPSPPPAWPRRSTTQPAAPTTVGCSSGRAASSRRSST